MAAYDGYTYKPDFQRRQQDGEMSHDMQLSCLGRCISYTSTHSTCMRCSPHCGDDLRTSLYRRPRVVTNFLPVLVTLDHQVGGGRGGGGGAGGGGRGRGGPPGGGRAEK